MRSALIGAAVAACVGGIAAQANADVIITAVGNGGSVSAQIDVLDNGRSSASLLVDGFELGSPYTSGGFSVTRNNDGTDTIGVEADGSYSNGYVPPDAGEGYFLRTSADVFFSFSTSSFHLSEANRSLSLSSSQIINLSGDAVYITDYIGYSFPFISEDAQLDSINFAVTPLPACAPLFGAALLALGGLTYARRHRTKPTPAPAS